MKKRGFGRGLVYIPWYRDLTLSTKEIVVARQCLYCNKLIPIKKKGRGYHPHYHHECFKKHREKVRKSKVIPVIHDPRPCIDCGDYIEEDKLKHPNAMRCRRCQYKMDVKTKRDYWRVPLNITVAVTCVLCGNIAPTHSAQTKYCKDCDKPRIHKSTPKRDYNEVYRVAKEYVKTINPTLYDQEKVERLGTFQTAGIFGGADKMARNKDGSPNFVKEAKVVNRLKLKTFSDNGGRIYHPTEGDYKRNLIREAVYYNK